MILSYDQRICTGQYQVVDLLGYRHTPDGDLIIKPDEAKAVRFIYLAYLFGYSCVEIANMLNDKNCKTPSGKDEWNEKAVWHIMQNERRHGDLHARKTIVLDYSKQLIVKNNKIRDSAYVPNHHKGIVTPEIAKAVMYLSKSGTSIKGMPGTAVITESLLKGFISICPAWKAMNIDMLNEICSQYYDENIIDISSDTEAQIFMPSGAYFIDSAHPMLTLSYFKLSFNLSCRKRISSEYVELLYHPILNMLALRSCSANTPNAIYKDKLIGITGRGFSNIIFEKLGISNSNTCRFKGITRNRGNETILFFMMDEVQLVTGNRKSREYTYPSPERNESVLSSRNHILNSITESDISQEETIIDNPLIGHVP